jgi:hypothetical protein
MNILKIRDDIKNNNIYVEKDSFYNNINNMSNNELSNLSWSVISEDFEDDIIKKSHHEINLTNSHTNTLNISKKQKEGDTGDSNNNKITDLNEIIQIIFENKKDLTILECQTYVSGYLRKNIKLFIDYKIKSNSVGENNTNLEDDIINIETYLKYLKWLLKGTLYFEKKLKLKPISIINNFRKNAIISRSSYKFCNFNYDCEFNYNKKKNQGCYAQHYVYNIVQSDIKSVINYLEKNKLKDTLNLKEVKKCIDTISFVINHMYEELKNVDYYNNGNSDELHKERTPVESKKRHRNKYSKKK